MRSITVVTAYFSGWLKNPGANPATKPCEKEPSANRRRKKLGMRKATKNASAYRPAPNCPAMTMSRTKPKTRDTSVIEPVVAVERNRRVLRGTSVWLDVGGEGTVSIAAAARGYDT